MSPFISNTMRRFSRSSSVRNSQNTVNNSGNNSNTQTPPSSYGQSQAAGGGLSSSIHSTNSAAVTNSSSAASSIHHPHSRTGTAGSTSGGGGGVVGSTHPGNGIVNDHHNQQHSRPISTTTDGSFDFANRPVTSHPPVPLGGAQSQLMAGSPMMSTSASQGSMIGGLSRTDQIVLKHFWEYKFQENCKRDLHYLKFPFFPQFPSHKDLLPYCEIYHLVKTSPGANIISLGSANGVYIGFELQTGSQLHIDMDDEWHNISHYRVQFKSYDTIVRDQQSDAVFKTWPKPLTIEYLEEQYQKWCLDLMSLCWEGKEVRELGGGGGSATGHSSSAGLGGNGVNSPIGSGDGKRGF